MPDLRKSRENSQFWPIGYNCYRIELKTLNLQIIMKKYAKNINTKIIIFARNLKSRARERD